MLRLAPAIVMCCFISSGSALAASSQSQPAQPNQQSSAASPSQQTLVTAQKLKQDLQNAGFTDVAILNEAFIVRAKSKNGDPIVMTIGPGGFEAVEAIPASSANTVGSTATGQNKSGNSASQPSSNQ